MVIYKQGACLNAVLPYDDILQIFTEQVARQVKPSAMEYKFNTTRGQ